MTRPRTLLPVAAAVLALGACAPAPRASPGVLAPTILSTEPWSFAGHTGTLTRTRGYRFFTTGDESTREHMPAFLEACLARYTSELAPLPQPPMRLDTFLLGDRDQWAVLTRQLMGEHAATYLRIQRGGFSSGGRAILWSIGRRDTFAIAAHEGWHQYTQRTFRDELPAWLEEGIGVYFEGLRFSESDPSRPEPSPWANLERFDQLRQAAASGTMLPVETLLASEPQSLIAAGSDPALNWYAQVWAFTLFLKEEHGPALRMLLIDAAHGTLEAALATRIRRPESPDHLRVLTAYFGGPRELEPGYRRFVARLVEADREAIAAGVRP
jgi:hypothetical protein